MSQSFQICFSNDSSEDQMFVLCCYFRKPELYLVPCLKLFILNVSAYVNKYAKLIQYFLYKISKLSVAKMFFKAMSLLFKQHANY